MSAASSALGNTVLLQHILEYVGFGHWLLAAGVCGAWRDVYYNIRFPSKRDHCRTWRYHGDDIRCTLASAVVASQSCLRWALDCGLNLHDGSINIIAGEHA